MNSTQQNIIRKIGIIMIRGLILVLKVLFKLVFWCAVKIQISFQQLSNKLKPYLLKWEEKMYHRACRIFEINGSK